MDNFYLQNRVDVTQADIAKQIGADVEKMIGIDVLQAILTDGAAESMISSMDAKTTMGVAIVDSEAGMIVKCGITMAATETGMSRYEFATAIPSIDSGSIHKLVAQVCTDQKIRALAASGFGDQILS